jgi:hypothetical protein
MKKILTIIILLLPLLAFTQQKPDGWLTPYANATFKDGKIVYTVANLQTRTNNPRLLPLMYPRNLVLLRVDNQTAPVNGSYIAESQAKIRDYIDTEPVNLRADKEKDEYLRLSAMVLLWDLKLSDHCQKEIKMLQSSGSRELKQNTGTVLEVLKVFEENR